MTPSLPSSNKTYNGASYAVSVRDHLMSVRAGANFPNLRLRQFGSVIAEFIRALLRRGQMRPVFASANVAHGLRCYAVSVRHRLLGVRAGANLPDLRFGELCGMILLSIQRRAVRNLVRSVFLRRSDSQVVRVDARRFPAQVAGVLPFSGQVTPSHKQNDVHHFPGSALVLDTWVYLRIVAGNMRNALGYRIFRASARDVFKPRKGFPVTGFERDVRPPVVPVAGVVHSAPAFSEKRFGASVDRADFSAHCRRDADLVLSGLVVVRSAVASGVVKVGTVVNRACFGHASTVSVAPCGAVT